MNKRYKENLITDNDFLIFPKIIKIIYHINKGRQHEAVK